MSQRSFIAESDRMHTSVRPIVAIKPKRYKQSVGNKPKGFWYSIGKEWTDFCKDQLKVAMMPKGWYRYYGRKHEYIVEITDESKMLILDTVAKVEAFTKQFAKRQRSYILIDWNEVSKYYDGIEFNPYFGEKYTTVMNQSWYNTINVPSGCIWNTAIIKIIPIKNLCGSKKDKLMEHVKSLILEGIKEKTLEDFIRKAIIGSEWEGKVFIAGGYVRDEFMGKDPKDLDLLVNAPNGGIEFAKWITKKVGAYRGGQTEEDPGSNPVIFPRFGTAKFNLRGVVHNGIDLSDMDIESVMPRKEQYTQGSRKPVVTGGELKDDVERRDFTVNSLLKDLTTGEILDLTGMGKADIQAGIVRTPLNPDKIFTDDPLRMLRAIRFAVKYQWKLPMFMLRGLKKNASQLTNISQERIRDELNKMLVTGTPDKAIKLLKVTGLLPYVIPELVPAVKMLQNQHHKHDVFDHTLDVLKKTEPVLVQRLMALFHDIGKTVTKTVDPDTKGVHFYGHELAGEKMVEDVMNRLKYPRELIDAVKLGVRNHMRLKQAGAEGIRMKDKTLLKFRNEMGEQLEDILKLMHADNIAHSEASSMPNQIAGIRQRLEKLKNIPLKPKMPITGNDLQALGLKPGPIFKEIMNAVAEAWYENPGLSKEEAIEIAKKIAKI